MKSLGLLPRIIAAILLGILVGSIPPHALIRVFVTFTSLFGAFLGFSIPLIIIGFIAPGIGRMGKGAGKLLVVTTGLSYSSTVILGLPHQLVFARKVCVIARNVLNFARIG
ncbi:hypothetical protein Q73_13130 [Bacillus coahuilensis m2-6]|uniref:Uncharacterized protein n=1 Tax=Bacillus coahuilensis p1.1.43 TaxID=1150625 RepID=A0A147K4N2_9BACI|nr:hypothetical protein Q75_15495 [Bacillus coahuilensis p1.1.43]KUP05470.1 hypothetical protein Q73_13130 [Bacillus coahuilensis m2-6]